MATYDFIRMAHGLIGILALSAFWTAGFTRKGSPLHKASGKIYLLTMAGILLTACPLVLSMLLNGQQIAAMFFAYLIVITTTGVWNSWRAIKDKRDWARYTGPIYKFLMGLNGVSGLAVIYAGLSLAKQNAGIFIAFSLVGILSALKMWRFKRKPPNDARWWLKEHFGAMIGNGVATHIAFLSIGLPKLLPMLSGPLLQNIAWLGPLGLSIVAGFYLNRKYMPVKISSVENRNEVIKTPEIMP